MTFWQRQRPYFNPRAPCGARRLPLRRCACSGHFNPRAPCGARHTCCGLPGGKCGFQSTRPVRGATGDYTVRVDDSVFQSTRPVRGATTLDNLNGYPVIFQSTRPVRGATTRTGAWPSAMTISIHAPRAGRDACTQRMGPFSAIFQSTRPVRGATPSAQVRTHQTEISIHAPRAGRDTASPSPSTSPSHFNPRAPCGARPSGVGRARL